MLSNIHSSSESKLEKKRFSYSVYLLKKNNFIQFNENKVPSFLLLHVYARLYLRLIRVEKIIVVLVRYHVNFCYHHILI